MFFNDWLSRREIYTPDREAVTDSIEGRRITYRDLNRRATALASWLGGERGVGAGDRVACLSGNRLEYLALFFACGKIGAVLVPLNYRLRESGLREAIGDCMPRVLVFEEEWREFSLAERGDHQGLRSVVVMEEVATVCEGQPPLGFRAHMAGLEETAMILYTSGTTGQAKGAMISWRQIHWNATNTVIGLQLTQEDVSFLNTPLYHTGGWHVLFTPLMHLGGRVVLQRQFDPQACNALVARERITILFGIPTTLRMMMETPNFAEADFCSLRMAICGGEPCPIPVIEAYKRKGVAVRQGYGLTEAGPNCFSLPAEDAERKAGSVGFPNFHVGARIEKADGTEAGVDEVGELLLSGPHLFSGYWNRPQATAETLAAGWLRTGDLFRHDSEGYYFVVGRKKEMFISGGENVYPAEVERALDRHPAIARSAVVGIPDEKWGESGCAFVVFHPELRAEEEELRSWCRQRLAGYQCPKAIFPIAELPLGSSGKIDKSQLVAMAISRLETNNTPRELGGSEPMNGVRSGFVDTCRLRVRYLETGPRDGIPVVFFHGNASSSIYWEETMLALPAEFRGIAPDLRGYGLSSREAIINATRGVGDWVDDAFALLEALKVERFHLAGHSLGGMVCWGLLADPRFAGRIESATLVAPAPPCGFGGVHGVEAQPNNPDFSGAGARLVHPKLVEFIAQGERGTPDPYLSPRAVMNRMFWKPPFRPAREEAFLSALLQVHLGERQFPGDSLGSDYWPGFAPGRFGPINAIAAKHNRDLSRRLLDAPSKPPLLMVIGDGDPVVSDASQPDPGFQGKSGSLPGWPGDEVFPPQPALTQLRWALSQYEARGGQVEQRVIVDCGHSPFIEKPGEFQQLFLEFLSKTVTSDFSNEHGLIENREQTHKAHSR